MKDHFEVHDLGLKDIRRLTNRHRVVMANLVLSFARMDTQLSNWLVEAFQMRSDRAALLLQNMSISTKYLKLIKFYEHEGPAIWAKELKASKKKLDDHAEFRNLVCHAQCVGVWARDPEYVLFLPLSYTPGCLGSTRFELCLLEGMEAATEWADNQAASMIDVWTDLAKAASDGCG
jgi:hypothetical protein